MNSLTEQIKNIIKENDVNSTFYDDYKKIEQDYQALIDKGWTTRRESQLPSINEKMAMMARSAACFNNG